MLVAKSLQGLANMKMFGDKEPYMVPMNVFCSSHFHEFQEFIDDICDMEEDISEADAESVLSFSLDRPSESAQHQQQPSPTDIEEDNSEADAASVLTFSLDPQEESTQHQRQVSPTPSIRRSMKESEGPRHTSVDPLTNAFNRLSIPAREGILSLPGAIDPARNLAQLVNMWLDSVTNPTPPDTTSSIPLDVSFLDTTTGEVNHISSSTPASTVSAKASNLERSEEDLARFHKMCLELRQKTRKYLEQVDMGSFGQASATGAGDEGITSPAVATKWVTIAERFESAPGQFWLEQDSNTRPASGHRSVNKDRWPDGADVAPWTSSESPAVEDEKRSKKKWGKLVGGSQGPANNRKASSSGSAGSGDSKKAGERKKPRKPSPPRDAQENAMRKLGWM